MSTSARSKDMPMVDIAGNTYRIGIRAVSDCIAGNRVCATVKATGLCINGEGELANDWNY
jgi:hypothetical protein